MSSVPLLTRVTGGQAGRRAVVSSPAGWLDISFSTERAQKCRGNNHTVNNSSAFWKLFNPNRLPFSAKSTQPTPFTSVTYLRMRMFTIHIYIRGKAVQFKASDSFVNHGCVSPPFSKTSLTIECCSFFQDGRHPFLPVSRWFIYADFFFLLFSLFFSGNTVLLLYLAKV